MSGEIEGAFNDLARIAEARARAFEDMRKPVALQDKVLNFLISPTVFADVYHCDAQSDYAEMATGYREVLKLLNQNQWVQARQRFSDLEKNDKVPEMISGYESAEQFQRYGVGVPIVLVSAWTSGLAAGLFGLGEGSALTVSSLVLRSTAFVGTRRLLEENITGQESVYDRQASAGRNLFQFGEEVVLTAGMFLFFGLAQEWSQGYLEPILRKIANPSLFAASVKAGMLTSELIGFTAWEIIERNYHGFKLPHWEPAGLTGQCLTPEAWRERLLTLLALKIGSVGATRLSDALRPSFPELKSSIPEVSYQGHWLGRAFEGELPYRGFENLGPEKVEPLRMGSSKDGKGESKISQEKPEARRPHPDRRATEPLILPIGEAKPGFKGQKPSADLITDTDLNYFDAETPAPSSVTELPTSVNQRIIHTLRITRPRERETERLFVAPQVVIENSSDSQHGLSNQISIGAEAPTLVPPMESLGSELPTLRPNLSPQKIDEPVSKPQPSGREGVKSRQGLLARTEAWIRKVIGTEKISSEKIHPLTSYFEWDGEINAYRFQMPRGIADISINRADFVGMDPIHKAQLGKLPAVFFKIYRVKGRLGSTDHVYILEVPIEGQTVYINGFPVPPGERQMLRPGDGIHLNKGPALRFEDS